MRAWTSHKPEPLSISILAVPNLAPKRSMFCTDINFSRFSSCSLLVHFVTSLPFPSIFKGGVYHRCYRSLIKIPINLSTFYKVTSKKGVDHRYTPSFSVKSLETRRSSQQTHQRREPLGPSISRNCENVEFRSIPFNLTGTSWPPKRSNLSLPKLQRSPWHAGHRT